MHLSATNAKTPILVAIVDLTASPVLEDDQVMFIECENTSRGHFFWYLAQPRLYKVGFTKNSY